MIVTVTNQMILDMAKENAAADPHGFTGEYLPENLRWFNPTIWLQGRWEPRRDIDWEAPTVQPFGEAKSLAKILGGRLPSLGEYPDLPTHWVADQSQNIKRWFDEKEEVKSNGDVGIYGVAFIVIIVE